MLTKKLLYAKYAIELCQHHGATWLPYSTTLFKRHKLKYNECMQANTSAGPPNPRLRPTPAQTPITATLHRATLYPSNSRRHGEITDATTFYLAKDVSNKYCEQRRLWNMVERLDKKYMIPSHNYFSKVALPALFEKCWGEIEREITADKYFANYNWHVPDNVFADIIFPTRLQGEAITHRLWEALASWSLQEVQGKGKLAQELKLLE